MDVEELLVHARQGPFRRFEVDRLLFVEYKCPEQADRLGIWCDCNYFVYAKTGRKTWRTRQAVYDVGPGDMVFVKKGATVAYQHFEEEHCALFLFLPDDYVRSFLQRMDGPPPLRSRPDRSDTVIRLARDPLLQAYFESVFAWFGQPDIPERSLLELKFRELLFHVMTRPAHTELAGYLNSLRRARHARLRDVMEANYPYNLNLEDYARLCAMSLSSFKRRFREVFGESPGRWLAARRLEFGRDRLLRTNRPVADIAFDSGFRDASHFARMFRRRYGMPPTRYRRGEVAGAQTH